MNHQMNQSDNYECIAYPISDISHIPYTYFPIEWLIKAIFIPVFRDLMNEMVVLLSEMSCSWIFTKNIQSGV